MSEVCSVSVSVTMGTVISGLFFYLLYRLNKISKIFLMKKELYIINTLVILIDWVLFLAKRLYNDTIPYNIINIKNRHVAESMKMKNLSLQYLV